MPLSGGRGFSPESRPRAPAKAGHLGLFRWGAGLSFDHLAIAAEYEIEAAPKLVLMILAAHACGECGLSWPGIPRLMKRTGLGETRIRTALAELRKARLLEIHAYPLGGRGRTTMYVVLPDLAGLSTAPCGKCQQRMQTPRAARGLTESGRTKAAPGAGFGGKDRTSGVQNPSPGADQSVKQPESVSARAREAAVASPHPSEPPPPSSATEARQAVDKLVRDAAHQRSLERSSHAKPDGKAR